MLIFIIVLAVTFVGIPLFHQEKSETIEGIGLLLFAIGGFAGIIMLCTIIIAVGAMSTFVPAIAITLAADAAMPSILTVTSPL